MNKEQARAIYKEVNRDIEKGIFNQYPKLKARLLKISKQLYHYAHVANCLEPGGANMEVLKEQGYLSTNK